MTMPKEINSSSPQAIVPPESITSMAHHNHNHNSPTGQNTIVAAAAAAQVSRKEFTKSVHARVLAKAGLIAKAAMAKNRVAIKMNRAAYRRGNASAPPNYLSASCHPKEAGHRSPPPEPGPRAVSVSIALSAAAAQDSGPKPTYAQYATMCYNDNQPPMA